MTDQIAALESEIKKLDTQIQRTPAPQFRSTAIPHGATIARTHEAAAPPPSPPRMSRFLKKSNHEPLQRDDDADAADQLQRSRRAQIRFARAVEPPAQPFSRPDDHAIRAS